MKVFFLQDTVKVIHLFEKLKSKYVKLQADIDFIECCKREAIKPTFTKFNLSIKSGGYKLKKKVAKLVMDTEIADKHYEMGKLHKQIRDVIIYN